MKREITMFEKNKKIIQEKYPEIITMIEEGNQVYKNSDAVKMDKAYNGELILKLQKNGQEYLLNSMYEPEKAAKKWANHYGKDEFQAVFFIYGLANGMYVKEIMEKANPYAQILVYEPDARIYYKMLNEVDLRELLSDERVMITAGREQLPILIEWLAKYISYMNYKKITSCPLPNYLELYKEEYNQVVDLINHHIAAEEAGAYTTLKYHEEFSENILHNIKDSVSQSTINQLKESMEDCDKDNIPVIIVAAGPSLDKNIQDLKKAKGKAFIMVVDTALKAVEKEGIEPDLAVTVDGHKPLSLFEGEMAKEVPFLYCKYSNFKLNNILRGRRFYCGHGMDFLGLLHMGIKGEAIGNIDSGGSVAHELFSLAVYLGFKKIILVGQDLAYPNGQGHVQAAYDGKEELLNGDKKPIWVEDINGESVLTEGNMDIYRRWFEKQIVRYEGKVEVIDATEGGAKIHGSIIKKLSDVIEEECKVNYNFKEKIASIAPSYTVEEQKQILDYFSEMPTILKGYQKEIEQGIEEYRHLSKLCKAHLEQTEEFRELVNNINARSQWIEEQGELELASLFNQEEEYEVQRSVYNVKDNEEDEIQDIVKKGIYMLESYIKGIDQLLLKWDEYII